MRERRQGPLPQGRVRRWQLSAGRRHPSRLCPRPPGGWYLAIGTYSALSGELWCRCHRVAA